MATKQAGLNASATPDITEMGERATQRLTSVSWRPISAPHMRTVLIFPPVTNVNATKGMLEMDMCAALRSMNVYWAHTTVTNMLTVLTYQMVLPANAGQKRYVSYFSHCTYNFCM